MRRSNRNPTAFLDQDRRVGLIEEIPQLHNKRILDPRLDIAFEEDKA